MKYMKYGLLTYSKSRKYFNIGDYIQSLAAKQYLPRVDIMVQRDHLNSLELTEKTSVIMNGWYTHHPENWPPVELLNPLFTSFHLNSSYADEILGKSENVDYFKKYSPIGCRDTGTLEYLHKYGINAYYSSCLTTTLDIKYKSVEKNNDILIVDLLYKNDYKRAYKNSPKKFVADVLKGRILKINERDNMIKSLIPKEILRTAKYLTHYYLGKEYNEKDRFEEAEKLLEKYAKAKLVITSRIHCALPCLALGTPVVFIAGGGLFEKSEMSRLKGTIEHLNIISTDIIDLDDNISNELNILNPDTIDWDNITNPTSYLKYADKLKKDCTKFVNKISNE